MRYFILFFMLMGSVAADDLSPHVRITRGGMQMSGVVVADGQVLTAAHAWTSGPVRVEFVGMDECVLRDGEVVRADIDRDLALVKVRTTRARKVKIGKVKSGRASVRGFRGLDAPMQEQAGNVLIKDPASGTNGERLLALDCEALSGLSGSGVVDAETGELIGIQSAGSKKTYCATVEQISGFLLLTSR